MHRRILHERPVDISFGRAEERLGQADEGPKALMRAMVAALREHGLKIAIATVLSAVLAIAYVRRLEPYYTASATILLEPRRLPQPRETGPTPALDLNRADSELQVIRSEHMLAQVFRSLELENHPELRPQPPGVIRAAINRGVQAIGDAFEAVGLPFPEAARDGKAPTAVLDIAEARRRVAFDEFAQRLTARRVGQSYVIEIAYRTTDRDLAPRVANAAASAYLFQSVAFKTEAARSGAEIVQGRVDILSEQARAAAAAMASGSTPNIATPDADARIIGAALAPLSPSGPPKTLIVALASLVGLVAGSFVVLLESALDRRIRIAEHIRAAGIRCLAEIPRIRGKNPQKTLAELDKLVVIHPEDSFASALRGLRAAIRLAYSSEVNVGFLVIAMVGWKPGVGCSLICKNLAHLTLWGGRPVTLIDADIHGGQRSISGTAAETSPSLVEALSGSQEVEFVGDDGIALLPARSPASPAHYFVDFAHPRMAAIIEAARGRGDVFLDLPPLAESPDAALLARIADVTVIVAQHGQTTIEEFHATVNLLREGGANVVGAVINRT